MRSLLEFSNKPDFSLLFACSLIGLATSAWFMAQGASHTLQDDSVRAALILATLSLIAPVFFYRWTHVKVDVADLTILRHRLWLKKSIKINFQEIVGVSRGDYFPVVRVDTSDGRQFSLAGPFYKSSGVYSKPWREIDSTISKPMEDTIGLLREIEMRAKSKV